MTHVNGKITAGAQGRRRPYTSRVRADQAAATRTSILEAAFAEFTAHGYPGTKVAAVARRAGVAVDTVYAAVGPKPQLLRAVVESAISGQDHAVPAEERDYVLRIRAARTTREKIAIYAAAVAEIQPRMARVYRMVRSAAPSEPEAAGIWQAISDRRAHNMRLFVADLRAAGGVREDMDDDTLADVVWLLGGTETWLALVEDRGWEPQRFEAWLAESWSRLLLDRT